MSTYRLAGLLMLFFGSGACGLIYQVLWLRLLSLVFGVTVYAASTVLAAFMAGLAIGSLLASAVARRARPLVAFAGAEVLVGVSALATPAGLDFVSSAYGALYRVAPDSLGLLTAARLATSMAVLLGPTILMGMTLPLLSASSLVRGSNFGARVGALYAVNTAGAVAGTVLAGFVLIGAIGISRTFWVAASVNVAVGVLALVLARGVRESGGELAPSPAPIETAVPSPRRLVLLVVGLSGFAALALEIIWFRVLVLFLPATTYAFTTMLATVLAGIAAGGAVAARLLRQRRDWLARLIWVQLATALATLVSLTFLGWSYRAGWRTSGDLQASVVAIFPPALLMGIAFPLAVRLAADAQPGEPRSETSRRVGVLYAVNVFGAIAGALMGGFLLLPALGTRTALVAMAGLFLLAAILLVAAHPARLRLLAPFGAGVLLFAYAARQVPDPFQAAHARRHGAGMVEVWREEGVQTTVTVHGSQFRRALFLDGLHQANDSPDMVRLHRVIGHLPMVLHPSPRRVLVVGLGGGATPGAVSQHTGAEVQIVELSASVARAASWFAHINYDVLGRPHVRLHVDDGRNFLRFTAERFDVITADIIQPIHAGAGSLYSREYFALMRRALAEGGVALQWIGHRPDTQYKLIMRTFLDAFPQATLWLDGNLMIGTVSPLRVASDLVAAKRGDAITRRALDEVDLTSQAVLRSWYSAGPDEMRRFVGEGPLLSDDRPLVEYHRSLPDDDPPVDISGLRGDPGRVFDP